MSLELENKYEIKHKNKIFGKEINIIYQTYDMKSDIKEVQEALIKYYIKHEYEGLFEIFEKHKDYIMMGNCYWFGREVEKDCKKAFKCYEKAKEEGNSRGWIDVSICYQHGRGVEKDKKKSFECSEKAGKMGDSMGWITTGNYYYWYGERVEENDKKAFKCYEKAKDMGKSQVWLNIGNCYRFGRGVKQDYKKAFECYEKARDMGNSRGWEKMAHCYYHGIGVGEDKYKSFKCYKEAQKEGRLGINDKLDIFDEDKKLFSLRFEMEGIIEKQNKKIEKQNKRIEELEKHILYRPGGDGFKQAQKDFEKLAKKEKRK